MANLDGLPGPRVDAWEWQLAAACRGMCSSLFFHPWSERGPARESREAAAKLICRGCPVITQCRQHAFEVPERYGIWGGLSETDRGGTRARVSHRAPDSGPGSLERTG